MPKAPRAGATSKPVHPNSRQALQLAKKAHRGERIDRKLKEKNSKIQNEGEKCRWFQEHLTDDRVTYTRQEACQLVELYLSRFDDELEQIGIKQGLKGRSGHQHASRQDTINQGVAQEWQDYRSNGMEIPDIINPKNLAYLREWNGELRFLQNIKMRRVKETDKTEKQSNKQNEEELLPGLESS